MESNLNVDDGLWGSLSFGVGDERDNQVAATISASSLSDTGTDTAGKTAEKKSLPRSVRKMERKGARKFSKMAQVISVSKQVGVRISNEPKGEVGCLTHFMFNFFR